MAYEIWQTCALVNIGLTRGECASWVQAWGSIAAILIAVRVSRKQYRDAQKLQKQLADRTRSDKARAVMAICSNALAVLSMLKRGYENGGANAAQPSDLHFLTDSASAFASIPLLETPGEVIVVHLAVMPRQLNTLAKTWTDANLQDLMVRTARIRDANMGHTQLLPLGFETPALDRLASEINDAETGLKEMMADCRELVSTSREASTPTASAKT